MDAHVPLVLVLRPNLTTSALPQQLPSRVGLAVPLRLGPLGQHRPVQGQTATGSKTERMGGTRREEKEKLGYSRRFGSWTLNPIDIRNSAIPPFSFREEMGAKKTVRDVSNPYCSKHTFRLRSRQLDPRIFFGGSIGNIRYHCP